MGYSNGIVSAPVSFDDVNQALGTSHTDLSTMCKATQINMWAKYKPVRWEYPDTTNALNQARTGWNPNAGNNAWWKAIDGNYGLQYSGAAVDIAGTSSGVHDALNSVVTLATGGLNGWTYQRPRGSLVIAGNPTEPYRLSDFLEYNHNAVLPIKSITTHNVYARGVVSSEFLVSVDYIESADVDITQRDYIRTDDCVGSGVTLYRGVAIYKLNGITYNAVAWCTGKEWLGGGIWTNEQYTAGDSYVETHLADGIYYILPVYFTCALPQNGANTSKQVTNTGYKVVAIPYTQPKSFRAVQSSRTVVLSNKQIASNYSYAADLSVANTGASATVVYTAAIVNENFTGTFDSGTYIQSTYQTGSVTIAQNATTYVLSFNVAAGGGLSANHTWAVYFKLDGTDYYINLIQPAQS